MQEQLIETWQIHNRINLYLLDAIPTEHLADVSASQGRNVGEVFAHLHGARLMWLQSSAPDLLTGLEKIAKEQTGDKELLKRSLQTSSRGIEAMLRQGLETGQLKGFKPHPVAFLGYLISHESHHRGQIALALKQSGHPLDKKIAFGIWEWGVR
jgi:uncharacterized damage-inducible protein DinB